MSEDTNNKHRLHSAYLPKHWAGIHRHVASRGMRHAGYPGRWQVHRSVSPRDQGGRPRRTPQAWSIGGLGGRAGRPEHEPQV